jgi:hypothetical protein
VIRSVRYLKADRLGTVIAHELYTHLKENNMTREPISEIYLRDVSTTESVELYFRHNLYKCQPSYYNSARANLYFAPYFTQKAAGRLSKANLVPVGEGISFVSRVEKVLIVETKAVLTYLKSERHPNPEEATAIIRKHHKAPEVLLMMLGEPRLMFMSPVTKTKLHRVDPSFTAGSMGSRSCTLDKLLAASR